jgi:hypothetical protein
MAVEETTTKINTFAAMNKRLDNMHESMEQSFKTVSKRFDVLYQDLDDMEAELAESNYKHSEHVKDVLSSQKTSIDNAVADFHKLQNSVNTLTNTVKVNTYVTYASAGFVLSAILIGLGFLIGGFF